MNWFLRDASCILAAGEQNYFKRLERAADLCQMFDLSIQITLDHMFFLNNDNWWRLRLANLIKSFPHVLIHMQTRPDLPFGNNTYTASAFSQLRNLMNECPNVRGISVHPDIISHFDIWLELTGARYYLALNVLGSNALFGYRKRHLESVLEKHPYFKLVLDYAHVTESQAVGEPSALEYAKSFACSIKEVQLSRSGNFYHSMPKGFDTRYSLFCIKGDYDDAIATLGVLPNANAVIKGAIPPGKKGEKLLQQELHVLRPNTHRAVNY